MRWQVESLITCRLDVAGAGLEGEGEGMVDVPGGRAESAHRLRVPMVEGTRLVRRRWYLFT